MNFVSQHTKSFNAKTKGKTLIGVSRITRCLKNIGIDCSRAQYFYPTLM